jgi:hypothetical protein
MALSGKGKFSWQEGRIFDRVHRYILSQEEHQKKKTFRQEYQASFREWRLNLKILKRSCPVHF